MKQQDPALKQVLQEQEDIRLSPNFCYRTLQRVEELARQRRQREERPCTSTAERAWAPPSGAC